MPEQVLMLKNLTAVDHGYAAAVFDRELSKIVEDCRDRYGDQSPRAVTLTVQVRPQKHGDGATVDVELLVNAKVPKQRTRMYQMGLTGKNTLLFRPDSPEDVRQMTTGDMVAADEAGE